MPETASIAKVAAALSAERMKPYLEHAEGDLSAAVRLYEWNLVVSGALYEALGILEVVLRNAIHERLMERHGNRPGYWYDDPAGILSDMAHKDVASARQRIRKLHRSETPGRVVAELSFGFWKFLLSRRYEASLWTADLRHAFPRLRPQRRSLVYGALDELHALRNRIAHHEPIYRRLLERDAETTSRILEWIGPEVREWADTRSRLHAVLAARPC